MATVQEALKQSSEIMYKCQCAAEVTKIGISRHSDTLSQTVSVSKCTCPSRGGTTGVWGVWGCGTPKDRKLANYFPDLNFKCAIRQMKNVNVCSKSYLLSNLRLEHSPKRKFSSTAPVSI